jgi:FMN-dependent NADH-azoreductase
MQLLHIDSSVLGPHSASRALSAEIVARQVALHPDTNVYPAGSPAAALEHHESYLTGVLSFIGLTDVTWSEPRDLRLDPKPKRPRC